jgi:hypothetical protein
MSPAQIARRARIRSLYLELDALPGRAGCYPWSPAAEMLIDRIAILSAAFQRGVRAGGLRDVSPTSVSASADQGACDMSPNPRLVEIIVAIVCFLLAAFPNLTAPRPIRWEWLGVCCLTLTLLT